MTPTEAMRAMALDALVTIAKTAEENAREELAWARDELHAGNLRAAGLHLASAAVTAGGAARVT